MGFSDGGRLRPANSVSAVPERHDAAVPWPRSYIDRPDGPRGAVLPMPRFVPSPRHAAWTADRPVSAQAAVRQTGGFEVATVGALIGDELRIPVLWCQFGSCIARFTHRSALGDQDLRVRALASGWRFDALGRLACPDCVQHDATFWITCPPVPVALERQPVQPGGG